MDKFIEFNGGVFNTRHIIAMTKCVRDWGPQYGIVLHVPRDVEKGWFDTEYERDTVFSQISRELLNK